jgi:hypothetical protein
VKVQPFLWPASLAPLAEGVSSGDGSAHALSKTDKSKQNVLCSNVVMAHAACFFNGLLQHFFCAWRQIETTTGMTADTRQSLHRFSHTRHVKPQFLQHPPSYTAFLTHQSQQKMLGSDVVVIQAFSFFVGETENPAGPLRETLHLIRHRMFLHFA